MSSKSAQPVAKSVPVLKSYPALVKAVQRELQELDFFVRRRTAESYWRVGKFVHEHLLNNQDRAGYGSRIPEGSGDTKVPGRFRGHVPNSTEFVIISTCPRTFGLSDFPRTSNKPFGRLPGPRL